MRKLVPLLVLGALSVAPGCTAITDFGHFHGGGGLDGSVDANVADGSADGGPDVGPQDGGPDTGADGGSDAGDVDGGGMCGSSCRPNTICCGTTCVDPTSTTNCHGCGTACAGGDHAAPACHPTGCALDCETGYGDCDGMASTGCEQNIAEPAHCGSCLRMCHAGEVCSGGDCTSSCPMGEMDCSGVCARLASDPDHCGSCAHACPSLAGTARTCMPGGSCGNTCLPNFAECDGNPSNGCEGLLTRYRDHDGDGFGDVADVGSMQCPMMAGYSASPTDCNDSDATVHPGAAEICNGADENCDGRNDETFVWNSTAFGATCQCETGSAIGTVVCAGPKMAVCSGGAETCNGLDDDCDGMRDETFSCVRGTPSSCTIALGACTTVGTATCTTSCTPGACIGPTETCNGLDDNCDGYVDSGAYALHTARGAFGTQNANFHAAWRGTDGAVVFMEDPPSGGRTLTFMAFDTNGAPVGSPVTIASSTAAELTANTGINAPFDIGWDGTSWQVFYVNLPTSSSSEIRRQPVSTLGVLGASAAALGAGNSVAVATAPGNAGIGVVMGASVFLYAGVFVNGAWTRMPSSLATGTQLDQPHIAFVPSGGYPYMVAASETSAGYIVVDQFSAAANGPAVHAIIDAQVEIDASVLYDPATDSGMLAYRLSGMSGSFVTRIDPSTGTTLGGPTLIGTSNGPQLVLSGGSVWINARPNVMRVRGSDMTLFPGEGYSAYCSDLVSVGTSLACFYGDSGMAMGVSRLLTCP